MGNNSYKKKHKEQGLCRDCPRPAIPGRQHCMICSEKDRSHYREWLKKPGNYQRKYEANKKLKALYKKTNRCHICGAPLGEQDEGRVTCMNCRDRKIHSMPKYGPIGGKLLENYYKEIASQS